MKSKRFISFILAFVLVLGFVPNYAKAEVEPANWVDDEKTARYWPIPHQGRLVKVSSAETQKNPSLRFIGGYTRPDGREVIRLALGGYSGALTSVWERMLIKPDANLNSMIDWSESGMGKEIPKQGINNHDKYAYNDEFVKFESLSSQQAGSGNVHVMNIGRGGTLTVRTGTLGTHFEAPIDLVLKDGETIKSLKINPLIQMRLVDSKYERIYSTTIEDNAEIPYSSYTMSTFIPVRVDLTDGLIMTDVVRNYENIFQSASSYIKYNEEKGYIDVFTRRTHGNVESKADPGGSFNAADGRNQGNYGFRQTFDASFVDILKPQDESNTVAQIFTANEKDEINYKSADPNVPKPGNRIDYSLDDIKVTNEIGTVEVTNNKPGETFMPTGTSLTGYGDSTVVRYFIDKEKLKESFGDTDIVAYEFFSTVFAENKTGVEEFKSTPRANDIDLKRGDKIHIRFDGRRDLIASGTFDTQGSYIQIGDDQFAIDIRTTSDKATYTGTGIIWNENYMKSMEVTVPFDIKIKKDTPVTIFSRKTKLQEVSPGMSVRFEYSTLDDSGNTVKKDETYRFERQLVDGYTRNEKGEIFKDGTKINEPQDSLFVDNHQPLVTSRQKNFAGGILTRTADAPDVDETFTDSENLTGRSKYDQVNVYLYDADKQKVDTAKRIGTIKASDKKIEMNVNGDDVQGYEWTSANNDAEHKLDASIWAIKDTPLYFTNQDVLQNALENEKPVVEQVQAKVKFDLNGGTIPLETKSYQGVDKNQKPGTEFAYVVKRSQETEAVTRIAPMNIKFANQEGYLANGFEGKNVSLKDHNGKDLEGDALELRKYLAEKPVKEGRRFLGWTTKKLEGTGKEVSEQFKKLEAATTLEQVNGEGNFIFNEEAPVSKTLTVYAAWGEYEDIIPQEPGEEKPDVPENYVLVEFLPGANGTIAETETTKYWVNPEAGKTLKDVSKPEVKANEGYKFTGWDKADTTAITEKLEVTAQYKAKVVTENPNDEDYVKVSFATTKGTIDGTKEYWVLKDEQVTFGVPTVNMDGVENYTFKSWDPEIKASYSEDTVHKATFTYTGEDIVPQNPGEDKSDVPENFVLVEFLPGEHGTLEGTTKYWVNKEAGKTLADVKEVKEFKELKVTANEGYKFTGWDKADTTAITEKLEVTAQYKAKVVTENPNDEDYVKVSFETTRGTVEGQAEYWVLKDEQVTFDVPTVNMDGVKDYEFRSWDPAIKASYSEDTVHNATFNYTGDDIVPQPGEEKPDVPENFVLVEFKEGEHGTLAGTNKYWVNPEANKTLADVEKPTVTPEENWKHTGWDKEDTTEIKGALEVTAQYKEKVVTENPNDEDYVKVDFASSKGTLEGTSEYWVLKDTEVRVPAPEVIGLTDYEFKSWDPTVKTTYTEDTTHNATFNYTGDDIVPQPGEDKPDVPANFVLVEFKEGEHGTLEGTTKYWVNPEANKTLKDVTKPEVKANEGYKFTGWDKADTTAITEKLTVTAKYKAKVVTENPNDEDYVKVSFETSKGTLEGTKEYWVLKDEQVTFAVPTVNMDGVKDYEFRSWDPAIKASYSEDTVHNATFNYTGNDIVPQPGKDKPDVPENFVEVKFLPGENGTIADTETTIYWVNPEAGKTLADVSKPEVTANEGYKFTGWDKVETTAITEKLEVTAQYEENDNVKYEPETKPIEKDYGVPTKEDEVIGSVTIPGYPEDKEQPKITVKDPSKLPDGKTPGEYDVPVVVEYPDGTKDEVTVKVTVKDQKDNEKYEPETKPIEKDYGVPTKEDEVIGSVTIPGYPEDKEQPKITVKDPSKLPDGKTPGEHEVPVVVEYPDGTKDEVTVKVTVKEQPTPEYTDDDIIPYLPNEEEPTVGSDDKTIPSNYITVTFESESEEKGEVKVGEKQGIRVLAKVKPGTNLAGKAQAIAKEGYGFTVWTPELAEAQSEQPYVASFIKSGDKVNDGDPIPAGWSRVTVQQDDNSIIDGTVTKTTYAVAPNDKLSSDKFVDLTGKAKEGFENPRWYFNEDTEHTDNPSEVAITEDTTITAKASEVVIPEPGKSDKPEVNKVTEGDDKITGKGKPGSDIVVELPDGTNVPGKVDEDGNWEVEVPADKPLNKDDKIKVVQQEEEKDPSDPVKAEVNEKPMVVLTFKPNGGTWSDNTTDNKYVKSKVGSIVDILEAPTREGYRFLFWKGSEYQPGDKYEVEGPHEFEAQWEKLPEKSNTPEVDKITEGDDKITGKGEPESDIVVELPDGTKVPGKVDKNGNWEVEVPADKPLNKDDKIKVVQKEEGKDPSDPKEVTVAEKPAPEKSKTPEVNKVTEGDKKITGKGEPGSDITVELPDGTKVPGKVDENGNWEVEIPADKTLKAKDKVKVVQKETGKEISDTIEITVNQKGVKKPGKVKPGKEKPRKVNPRTGDAGIMLTATITLLSAAAYVFTRKLKRED